MRKTLDEGGCSSRQQVDMEDTKHYMVDPSLHLDDEMMQGT
jgi:hypothetical protein